MSLEQDIATGRVCAGCQDESFVRAYGMLTLCTTCWGLCPPDERGPFLKANRNDQESVLRAKSQHRKTT